MLCEERGMDIELIGDVLFCFLAKGARYYITEGYN